MPRAETERAQAVGVALAGHLEDQKGTEAPGDRFRRRAPDGSQSRRDQRPGREVRRDQQRLQDGQMAASEQLADPTGKHEDQLGKRR